jgi:hypothetical protein
MNSTRTAVAVKPALVEPTPVVNTARGIIFATYLRKNDFPVPEKKHFLQIKYHLCHTGITN